MRSSLRLLQQQGTCQAMHEQRRVLQSKTSVGRHWTEAQDAAGQGFSKVCCEACSFVKAEPQQLPSSDGRCIP